MRARLVAPIALVLGLVLGLFGLMRVLPLAYLDLPSLLVVPLAAYLYILTIYGFRGMARAYRAPFDDAATPSELRQAEAFFVALIQSFAAFGVLTMLFGLVAMMVYLEDKTKIGPNLAVALLTLFYAALCSLTLALPFLIQARKRLAAGE